MTQNVSMEAALPIFRQRCSELHDENLILRARVAELEKHLAEAQQHAPAPQYSPDQVPADYAEPAPSQEK